MGGRSLTGKARATTTVRRRLGDRRTNAPPARSPGRANASVQVIPHQGAAGDFLDTSGGNVGEEG